MGVKLDAKILIRSKVGTVEAYQVFQGLASHAGCRISAGCWQRLKKGRRTETDKIVCRQESMYRVKRQRVEKRRHRAGIWASLDRLKYPPGCTPYGLPLLKC